MCQESAGGRGVTFVKEVPRKIRRRKSFFELSEE